MSMYDDDDFDELMADVEIGNFDGFMLSEEEVEAGKKERKAQIERDVKELRELMDAAEAAQKGTHSCPSRQALLRLLLS